MHSDVKNLEHKGLNRAYIGKEYPPVKYQVKDSAIESYALAYGSKNVIYFRNSGKKFEMIAPPIFAVVFELPLLERIFFDEGLHGGKDQMSRNLLMLVHGEQDMRFYKPIKPGDIITSRARIKSIEDKGSGEIFVVNVVSHNQEWERVGESDWNIFVRGIGSGRKKTAPSPQKIQKKEPELSGFPVAFRKVIRVAKDVTFQYAEASGDRNPIHIDEKVAKAAGLGGIIVHGLCTMAMTMRAIVDCYLDYDPTRIKRLSVRFASPVYPGDTLIVDGWEAEKEEGRTVLGFEARREEDGVKVIKNGIAELEI